MHPRKSVGTTGRRFPSRVGCSSRFSLPTTFPYRLRCATSVYTCTLPHVSSLPRIGSTVWVCSEASMCVRDTRDQNCSRSVPWGADKQVDRPACNLVMLLCMFCGGMFEASLKHGWIPRMQSNNLQCQPFHGTSDHGGHLKRRADIQPTKLLMQITSPFIISLGATPPTALKVVSSDPRASCE